ncbi:putative repeat protein (TIGR02543 family)/predicted secreted protein (Por secretion system target) [Lutibacter sp. Hel_I_33_5]|uniref:InlB B-repeat-containing protein n=1 Tax=Lutibacter sp. Hel_I_33_5 TaxID=1566289 RepID=UPI0011AA0B09|nr:InlB B-repeat-containing protein [Lutibacter sp. Hel_I_33_5]TVZ54999.1 putative repeat protein (TIGR02543 family)/predicted secreted protein (Por secretion system target) [Lutibacter sp. Hel_I_33_5]
MKSKLFFLLLFVASITYAQIPTNGLYANYDFTNGVFTDAANAVTFTQTGTALANIDDRFTVANNAISLNGDHLTRTDVAYPSNNLGANYGNEGTVSFWIKTTTNDTNKRIIIDDSNNNSSLTSTTWTGYYVFLQDGKIGVSTRVLHSGNTSYRGSTNSTTPIISDGNWHHVVMTIGNTYSVSSSGLTIFIRTRTRVFIDGLDQGEVGIDESGSSSVSFRLLGSHDTNGNFTVGNNRTNNLSDSNRFHGAIDDLNIYTKRVTQAEVTQLATINNFCFPPLTSIISTANITETTADVSWSESGTFDLAYVAKGQPFANATIVSNINYTANDVQNLTGLQPGTIYNVYLRRPCANSTMSSWSSPLEVRTNGITYVNKNATGTNDGTSWTNAYTDLQGALSTLQEGGEIWVAKGTYTPHASSRTVPFAINKKNVELYGGFNGTETTLNQRDLRTNETILSGDLSGDDIGGSRSENAYHVIDVNQNDIVIDGFIIQDGVANSTANNSTGAGIFKRVTVNSLTVKNSTFKNNYAGHAAGINAEYTSSGGTLDIENCIFDNNIARHSTSFAAWARSGGVFTFKVTNSLFSNNEAKNLSGAVGFAASAGWFRSLHGSANVTTSLVNNTYVNNNDIGTHSYMNNLNRATVGASTTSGTLNLEAANCIFWNNTITGGVIANAISGMHTTLGQNVTAVNSIDQGSFSKLTAANLTNTSNADPLLKDAANNEFILLSGSPAINTGDNSKLPATFTKDLLGKDRIVTSTIDVGAYEFDPYALFTYKVNVQVTGNGTVNHPVSQNHDYGTVLNLVATPAAGYKFNGWTGDIVGNTNTLGVLVNNTINITANFVKSKIYVNKNATGNNDGTTWPDAYTSLTTALSNTVNNSEIWVAAGTYTPNASDISVSFNITKSGMKIYGGFAGTETKLSDRVLGANETILSGDLGNDDNNVVGYLANYNETSRRNVNSTHIVKITTTGNDLLLDGLTISDAHNSLSTTEQGGAIVKNKAIAKLTLKNCIIKNNVSRNASAGLIAEFELNNATGTRGVLTIENCEFTNNFSRWGTGIYSIIRSNTNVDINISNTLFNSNTAANLTASALGFSGSAGWFRMLGSTSDVDLNFTNNTLVNNTDTGTEQSLNASTHAVFAISRHPGFFGTFNAVVSNSIFWNNKTTGNVATKSITDLYGIPVTSVNVYNSIDENNFNDSLITSTTATSDTDPSFTDLLNGDFSLTTSSPAKDSGDNTYVTTSTDLLGNQRIFNTTVDMGVYEFGSNPATIVVTRTLNTSVVGNGTVTTNPNPTNGTYTDGAVVAITATPDAGYQFDGWSGDATGSTNPLSVTMDADKAYKANFSLIKHTLTINATNGTVTPNSYPTNGTYLNGTVVTLTATPNTGYQFDGWSGDVTGTTNPQNITIDTDKTVTAIFSLIPVTQRTLIINATNGNITVSPNPNTTTNNSGTYDDGTVVTLTPDPDSNYEFSHWTGDFAGTGNTNTTNPLSITMDADKSVTAMFSKIQRTLTINATNGTVTTNPNPTNGTYDDGTVVGITATPNAGYQFDSWSGDATGTTNPLNITMDSDKSVTAMFSKIQRTLTITATNGTVTTNPNPTNGTYDDGTVVGITATPNTGYQFDGWSGDATGTTNPLNITMDSDKSVTAMFSKIQRTLTITATNGTVTTNPNPTNGTYDDGTVVGITATPNAGYQFDGWSGDATGTTNPLNITMDADKSVTAMFSKIQRTLTITATNGTITTNPNPTNGTYDDGTVVGITATPNAGYQFDGWSGDATGTTNSLNITMDADKSVTAMFSKIQRTLTITATNGTVTTNPNPTNGTYDDGTVVGLTATPNTGYQFVGWSGDATGTINPLSITMDASKNITAIFSSTASINDHNNFDFKMFPNPTNGKLTVELKGQIKAIDLFNLQGQIVKKFTTKNINIHSISNGIYLMKITTEKGEVAIKKVIKN